MRMRLASLIGLALAVALPVAHAASVAGDGVAREYRGDFEGVAGVLRIGPIEKDRARIIIDAQTPIDPTVHCSGKVSGYALLQGTSLAMQDADNGQECKLTIVLTQLGANVQEILCSGWHGASCSFDTHGEPLPRVR